MLSARCALLSRLWKNESSSQTFSRRFSTGRKEESEEMEWLSCLNRVPAASPWARTAVQRKAMTTKDIAIGFRREGIVGGDSIVSCPRRNVSIDGGSTMKAICVAASLDHRLGFVSWFLLSFPDVQMRKHDPRGGRQTRKKCATCRIMTVEIIYSDSIAGREGGQITQPNVA